MEKIRHLASSLALSCALACVLAVPTASPARTIYDAGAAYTLYISGTFAAALPQATPSPAYPSSANSRNSSPALS